MTVGWLVVMTAAYTAWSPVMADPLPEQPRSPEADPLKDLPDRRKHDPRDSQHYMIKKKTYEGSEVLPHPRDVGGEHQSYENKDETGCKLRALGRLCPEECPDGPETPEGEPQSKTTRRGWETDGSGQRLYYTIKDKTYLDREGAPGDDPPEDHPCRQGDQKPKKEDSRRHTSSPTKEVARCRTWGMPEKKTRATRTRARRGARREPPATRALRNAPMGRGHQRANLEQKTPEKGANLLGPHSSCTI